MLELYRHNKETYSHILTELKTTNHLAIVQGTGTGKSYLTMKLFQDHFSNLTKLYVVPTNAIADSIQLYAEWSNEKVVFTTYQMLATLDERTLYLYTKAFDVFLLDEFHHAGAPTWSVPIQIIKQNARYMIGLSATPIRHLDRGRNMIYELFDGHVIYGPSLEVAVRTGILPKFKYVAILGDVYERIQKAERTLEDYINVHGETKETIVYREKIKSLYLDDYSAYETGVILRKYKEPTHLKWLVFCSDMEQLETIDLDLKDWFNVSNIKILSIHSRMSKKEIKNTLQEFSSSKTLTILKSIDILNEGVHVDGVNALIMLRKTESPNLFKQQLGRGLSAGKKGAIPLIIDVVGNYDNLKDMASTCRQILGLDDSPEVKKASLPYESFESLIVIDDMLLEVEELFTSINNLKPPVFWEEYKDAILREHYPNMGPSVCILIPGTDKTDCTKRARQLGLIFKKRWTPSEDDIIIRYYPSEGKKVAKRLENREEDACAYRASKLKVKYLGDWRIEDDILLMTFYGIEKEESFKRLPGKSVDTCREHVRKLKLY